MSIDRIVNALKRHISAIIAAQPQPRWGIVTSVDPSRPAVKVRIMPDDVPSGWLPVAQPGAGASATVLAPIMAGTQAFLVPEHGSPGHDYTVVGFAHSDATQIPPAANTNGTGGTQQAAHVPWAADEWLIVHKSGSVVRMTTGGGIYCRPANGVLMIDGALHVNGAIEATGAITAGAGDGDSVGLQTHTHTQNSDSHGDTEQPTNAPTAGT